MPSLKDIRRRIGSVEKTQQITRAMRMVAAAKLRRAQDAIVAARPYAERMGATLAAVGDQPEAEHPLLAPRDEVKTLGLVVIASDRGLCGAFNSNVIKRGQAELLAWPGGPDAVQLTLVGRKAVEFFRRRRPGQIDETFTGIARVEYAHAQAVAQHLSQRFLEGRVDAVRLVFSEFVTTMTQTPRVLPLLPVTAADESGGQADADEGEGRPPFDIEPSPRKLLEVLVPKALEVQIYRALLENQAGEHAARMAAMESATRNSEEMIDRLTLQYNRARQAAITKELVEIVSGAEAL